MVPPHTKLTVWSYCVQSLLGVQGGLASPLLLHVVVGQVALKIPHLQKVLRRDSPVATGHLPVGWVAQAFQKPLGWAFSSSVEIWRRQERPAALWPCDSRIRKLSKFGVAAPPKALPGCPWVLSHHVHTRTLYRGKPRLRGHDCKDYPGQCGRAGTRSLVQCPRPALHHNGVLGVLLGSRLSLQQGDPRPGGGSHGPHDWSGPLWGNSRR